MKFQARYLFVYFLLGLTALFVANHENVAVPVNKPLTNISTNFNEWSMVRQTRFNPQVLEKLKPTDYLYRIYKDNLDNRVRLYIGYHSGGPDSGQIHSPKHCLPGGGWFELSEEKRTIRVPGQEMPIIQAVYQKDDRKELFLYFFQVKGKILSNEYSLKIAEIFNSILYNRRDAAFIRISVEFENNHDDAANTADRFLAEIYPHITEVLPL